MAGRPIDEKIVAMKMDNSDLKNKAAETTSIFGKMRDSLGKAMSSVNFSSATKELANIKQAANSIDMTGLARSVEGISSRFSNLGIVATTALVNIANKATNAGLALANSLTSAPVMDGFREYELKMGSIQTMLANTEWEGTTLNDVKKTLGELNNYADKTIYDFGQMTQSIGKWTAAGVGLKDSTIAIKGMGNLAAISGASVDQLNSAMYQMSQGMSAGKFGAIDWISLDNAGMGGKKTKDALIETAKLMGKTIDMSKGFKGSLEQGWLTSEVFLETMKKFGTDESMTKAAQSVRTFTGMIGALKEGVGSGWAETWELIFGDFEVATKRWTALSKVIGGFFDRSTKARNSFVKALADMGVFQMMFDLVTNLGGTVLKVFDAIGNGIKKAFGFVKVDGIVKMVSSLKGVVSGLKPSEQTLSNISTIFQAIASVVATVVIVIVRLANGLISLIPDGLVGKLVGFLAYIAKMVIAFTESVRAGDDVKSSFSGLSGIFAAVGGAINWLVKSFSTLGTTISEVWNVLASGKASANGPWSENSTIVKGLLSIRKGFQSLVSYIGSLDISLSSIGAGIKNFFTSIGDGFNWFKEKMSGVGESIKNVFSGITGNDLMAGGFIAGLLAVVGMVVKVGYDLFKVFTGWGKIGEGVTDTLESVSGALDSFAMSVKANALMTIAIAVGVLAASLFVISRIEPAKIANGLYGIIGALTAVVGAMWVLSAYDIKGTGLSTAVTMVAMGAAIMIMAGALKQLSTLNPAEMTKGIIGLVALMGTLSGAVVLMSKFGGGNVAASSLQFIAIAGAIHILLSAVKKIAEVSPGDLIKGVTTLGVILLQLAIFLDLAKGSKFGPGSALGILAIAGSIHIIASAISKIAEMDVEQLKVGLVTIGAILIAIAAFSQITSGTGLLATGAGIMLLAVALNVLMIPIATLGNMDIATLAIGLGAMAIALVAIGAASMLMTGMLAAGAGLILVAVGLNLLIAPIAALGSMSWETLVKGIVGLGLGLAVIGGIAALLGTVAVPMLAFAGAMALLGIAMLAAGAGMALFSTGLLTLATLTASAIVAIVATLGTLIIGLASLIPKAVDFVEKLMVQLIDAMGRLIPKLAATVVKVLLAILNTIGDNIPPFIDAGVKIITNLLDGMAKAIPRLHESALNFIVTLLTGMSDTIRINGPQITSAMLELMGEIIIVVIDAGVQMITALYGWIPGVKKAASEIGTNAEKYIRDNFGAKETGSKKGDEFSNALDGSKNDAKTAGKNVGEAGEKGADSADLKTVGTEKGTEFVNALANKATAASTSGKELATGGKTGAGSIDLTTTGSNFGQGFVNGIASKLENVKQAASSLASAAAAKIEAVLDMHSPSKVTTKLGEHTGQGFANGISNKKKEAEKRAKEVADAAKKKFKTEMDNLQYNLKMDKIDDEKYIQGLEKLKKKYSEYGELVKKVNLEIKKTRDKIEKEEADARQKSFDDTKKYIDEKNYYHEYSLIKELNAYQKAQAKYKEGTEQRKQADREVYRLKNEINQKLISINDEYTKKIQDANQRLIDGERSLNAEYETAVNNRTKSLSSFAGIFDLIEKKSDISGQQLLTNLESQYITIAEWAQNMKLLASKGIDEGLLEELRQMGPRAAGEIAALNTLSEEELARYSMVWKDKNSLARLEATTELEGLKADTATKIDELRAETATNLETYKTEWIAKIKEIRNGAKNQFVGLKSDLTKIGVDSMKGLKNGLISMEPELMAEAKRIADAIAATIASALQVHSPSRVTMRIGEFVSEGLAVGIANKAKQVGLSAKNLALTAKDSLNQFIDGFELPEDNNELHFKAVIDYDGFDPSRFGVRPVNLIPDTSFANNNLEATRVANRQNANIDRREPTSVKSSEPQQVHINQELNFHSQQLTPSEVARKNIQASRQLAMQWG